MAVLSESLESPAVTPDSGVSADNAASTEGQISYTWRNLNVWTDPPKPSIFSQIKQYFKSKPKPHRHHHHGKHRHRHKHQTAEEDEVSRKTITSERWMLLSNVSGTTLSGQLTGILGASGSGKSLLLNTLAFRAGDSLHINGERVLNGEEADFDSLSPVLAYVQQEDMFIGSLSVREHLTFQARLRMSSKIPFDVQMARVEEVIGQFGLRKCADTVIGVAGRVKGISGGEQKRLAFATEVLTDPPILFCDEPTSGLDSFMAYTVVSVLKDLAVQNGKAVMTTIHQPSTDCFSLFDNLIVLAEGRIAYSGPAASALEFMASIGYPSPPYFNPAEFITCSLTLHPEEEEESRERIETICSAFEDSAENQKLMEMVDAEISSDNSSGSSSSSSDASSIVLPCARPSPYKASWLKQTRVLWLRSALAMVKDPLVNKIRLAQAVAFALTMGCIYYQQKLTQDGVQNINGYLFIYCFSQSFTNAFNVLTSVCVELDVVRREHTNGMYSPSAYLISKIFTDFPLYTVLSIVIVLITFYMMGMDKLCVDASKTLSYFLLYGVSIAWMGMVFGYFASSLTGKIKYALIFIPAVLFPYNIIGGVYMVGESKAKFLNWVRDISWMSYLFHNMVIAQWDGVTGIRCNRLNSTCLADGTMTGQMILTQLKAGDDVMHENMWIVVAQFCGYMLLAYLTLLRQTSRRT